MDIYFYQKLAYRYQTPSDPSLDGHLQKVTRRFIAKLGSRTDAELPQIGDVYYVRNTPYEIKRRIFMPNDQGVFTTLMCEVVEFNGTYICSRGSNSWEETIPLVTELPDDDAEDKEDDGQRSSEDTQQ